MDKSQVAWFIGLITCVCTAVLGQAELIGEPWRHWISVVSIGGTAATGYMLQPARNSDSRDRVNDPEEKR